MKMGAGVRRRVSSLLIADLALLAGRKRGRGWWWLLRNALLSIFLITLGIYGVSITGRLILAQTSLIGLWQLVSALMIRAHFEARETGILELILQRMGGAYLTVRYAIYTLFSVALSVLTVLLSAANPGLSGLDDLPLMLGMCLLGPITYTTVTTALIVAVGGDRILDWFSYAMIASFIAMMSPLAHPSPLSDWIVIISVLSPLSVALVLHLGRTDRHRMIER